MPYAHTRARLSTHYRPYTCSYTQVPARAALHARRRLHHEADRAHGGGLRGRHRSGWSQTTAYNYYYLGEAP